MAYGWQAWKQRKVIDFRNGTSRQAKERGYLKGFRDGAKEYKIDASGAVCPGHVLDDPGIDAGGAYDLGQWDAKAASKRRTA